jgi:RHS repeat-associated protein
MYDPATALSYLNARYYDGGKGEFTSQDPSFLAIGDPSQVKAITGQDQKAYLADPQQFNSYSYGRNNPITLKDPDGRAFVEVNAGVDINPYSANLRLMIDSKNGRVDIGYGGGLSAGVSAAATGFYSRKDLPEANNYFTEGADYTQAFGVAVRGQASNTQTVEIPTKSKLELDSNIGVGAGLGRSVNANIDFNFTLIDLSKHNGVLIQLKHDLITLAQSVQKCVKGINNGTK